MCVIPPVLFHPALLPTLSLCPSLPGSHVRLQEGAFENVRMNYSGDQGQTIRQLISAHVLRRVAMCVLSSSRAPPALAVSHEKGKVGPPIPSLSFETMLVVGAEQNTQGATLRLARQENVCFYEF